MEVREDDVVVEEEDVVEEEAEDTSDSEEEEAEDTGDSEEEDNDDDDRVVTFGDEEPTEEPEAPGWVKKVRKVNRKLESENKRLKKQLQERSTEQAPPVEQLGEKPTLKSAGYDDKKYEQALTEYYERKRRVEEYEAQKAKAQEEQQKQWQTKQQRYVEQKESHSFKDFEEAEELVSNTFDITQQGILVQGAEDSALVVYALGKNPKKLEELAKVTDPVDFAFKVAKLEAQLKVTSKKAPSPEKRVSGGKAGGLSGSEDKTLERLRAEAEKTGDYTKIRAYKAKKRNK